MLKGILLVLGACFIWGLIFVIPGMMVGFSPIEVALGRYFFLGLISCIFMLAQGLRKWMKFPWSLWRQACLYALVVNILYYFSLVNGLRFSNASVIALLLGLSPITVAFYGNWQQKECSYRQLLIPSLLIGCGLICVNWPAFSSLPVEASWEYGFGLLCGVFSLIAWNWYMVANVQFFKQNPNVSSSDWSTLIGVGTFVWVVLIGFIFFTTLPSEKWMKYTFVEPSFIRYLVGSLVLGIACSWLGSYLWNSGCQVLPISLAGQLTIFETIFGLIFVYLLESQLPSLLEFIGIITILGGVGLSMHRFRKPHSARHSQAFI
jgi:drug/metabolite transporter (DMT)-like permease